MTTFCRVAYGGAAFALLTAAVCVSSVASPSVSVRLSNLNLAVSFTDVAVTSDADDYMRVKRLYSSLSTFSHIFGYGWGSDLDTNLVVRPDGVLWLTQYGNGFTRVFSETSNTNPNAMLNEIEGGALQEGMIGSDDELAAYSKESSWDVMNLYQSMRNEGYLAPGQTMVGAVFSDYANGFARVVAVPEGYQLVILGNDRQWPLDALFDGAGKLIRIWVHGHPEQFISYGWSSDAVGHHTLAALSCVLSMSDYRGNVFRFQYDTPCGRVKHIDAGRFGAIDYRYDGKGDLRSERDSSGLYRYLYDDYHDLTGIDPPHGDPLIFKYADHVGTLKSLQCSDGTTYEFTVLSQANGYATSMRVDKKEGTTTTSETMGSSQLGVYTYCS